MNDIFRKKPYQTRWASFENPAAAKGLGGRENRGAKGHAFDSVAPGETKVLLDVSGSGIVHRIWLTLREQAPEQLRAYRLDVFWDGAEKAAVSVPLGDFFCAGLGLVPFENALFASPEGQSLLCTIPMPFRSRARITLTNESAHEIPHLFYDVNVSLNVPHDADVLYFHAHWRRENPTTLAQDFEILPRVTGNGRFLGAHLCVITDPVYEGSWWGEGEVKVYLDGDNRHPTLVGTGTEDYIGTGWGQETFIQQDQGSLIADPEKGHYAFYRFHLPDPIYFQQDCRVTVQQIGGANKIAIPKLIENGARLQVISADGGSRSQFFKLLEQEMTVADSAIDDADWCNFFRQDDWAALAYFYLDRPSSDLPLLADVASRVAELDEQEPQPAAVSSSLVRSLYVSDSLRAKQNGFAFNLQNVIGSGTLVGFKGLTVDGRSIPSAQITLVSLHGVQRSVTGISNANPLLFPINTTLRVQVDGMLLEPGQYDLTVRFSLREIPGILEINISDYLTMNDETSSI